VVVSNAPVRAALALRLPTVIARATVLITRVVYESFRRMSFPTGSYAPLSSFPRVRAKSTMRFRTSRASVVEHERPGLSFLLLPLRLRRQTVPVDRRPDSEVGRTTVLRPSSRPAGVQLPQRALIADTTATVLFCSLAFLDPSVGHTVDVLSPFISILCHSD